jgi:major membrane immunogen (membrane-anchored lipoprotein)
VKKPFRSSRLSLLFIAVATLAISALSAMAQAPTFDGKYEGTAKAADGSLLNVIFDLKNEGGKVTGTANSGATTIKISEGTLAEKKLTLKFEGHTGVLNATVDGDKINGEWVEGEQKRTVELKKTAATASTAASTPFTLAGDWEAVADANGQPFPFLLVLKVDGEKVTGSSSSQLGESTVTNGTWKEGRLAFQLESANGAITMSATVVEGKLSGEFDYAGQLQGRWVAVKKK